MRLKKFFTLLISFCLILTLSLYSVNAAMETTDGLQSTYFRFSNAHITVGVLQTTVEGHVQGVSGVRSIKIKLELQKQSGSTYSTIKSWEETFNSDEAIKTESKLTSPLSTYRLKATFTVYTSSSSETKTMYAYDS